MVLELKHYWFGYGKVYTTTKYISVLLERKHVQDQGFALKMTRKK